MPPVDSAGRLLVVMRATAVIAQNTTVPDGLQEAVGWVNNPSQRGTLMLLLECLKWMLITILFPEFIFAKGVCELRFAIHTLKLMAERVNGNAVPFESQSTQTTSQGQDFVVIRGWQVDYGPWMQLLHALLVRRQDAQNIAVNPPEEDGKISPSAKGLRTSSMARVDDSEHGGTPEDAGIRISEKKGRQESRVLQFWTIVHAYYANMGGLIALKCKTDYENDVFEYSILRGDHLASWDLREWRLGHPLKNLQLSAAEIEDKSKADWLVKLFSMFQISRLILDLINRAASHRPVTQIELGTAAFAVFALITYMVNWWKPKDISQPTSLHAVVDERRSDEAIERSAESFFSRLLTPMPRTLHYRKIASPHYRIRNDELWMDGDYPVVWPLMAASCVVFGAFHCIAWRWQFPTDIERLLWQISSVVSTLSPLIPLAYTYFLIRRGTRALSCHQNKAVKEALGKLGPLRDLPKIWIQLSQTIADDPDWRPVLAEESDQDMRDYIIAYAKRLLELKEHLSALEKELERDRQANLLENIWKGLAQLKKAYGFLYVETWEMYEEQVTLVAQTRGIVALTGYTPKVLEKIHMHCLSADTWTCRKQYQESKKQLQEKIRRYARRINICFGIVYSVSRITLIIIMFSSLREVPKGVYEVPGWTRFLPSFS